MRPSKNIGNKKLEHIYNILIDRMLNHSPDLSRNRNLSSKQYKAIESLHINDKIVIKKADKGSNIVIQNLEDYVKEGLRQLQDSKFYIRLHHDPNKQFKEKIDSFLGLLFSNKRISKKTYKFLISGSTH